MIGFISGTSEHDGSVAINVATILLFIKLICTVRCNNMWIYFNKDTRSKSYDEIVTIKYGNYFLLCRSEMGIVNNVNNRCGGRFFVQYPLQVPF